MVNRFFFGYQEKRGGFYEKENEYIEKTTNAFTNT